MAAYYVPHHVHFTVDGDTAIFMNLRADQYSMLVGSKAQIFRTLLSNSRACEEGSTCLKVPSDGPDIDSIRAVVADLLEYGLLTAERTRHPFPRSLRVPQPEQDLLAPCSVHPERLAILDVWRFVSSCMTAMWRLKCTSIEDTVRAVQKRGHARNTAAPIDLCEARRLVSIYSRLRRLVPKRPLCLYDSLSLVEFLAKYNCFPCWVFGVKVDPWTAHCWVQQGTIVFNQDAGSTRTFLTLFAV